MAFGGFLKQSTAVDVLIGPFLDEGDGKTAETGLTLAQADIKLSKNGQTLAQKNDDTSAVHDSDGYYNCELDTTDTNTVGQLVVIIHESGALPCRHEYQVVEEIPFDEIFKNGATGVNAACDTALTDYDPPTKAEIDTGHGLLATEAKQDIIDTNVDQIETAVITNAAGTDVAADIIAVKAETALIVADTNELQTDDIPGTISTHDGKLDTAQADLDTITGASGVLIDTDAVDADALKADAITEIWAKALSDLAAGAPSATASVLTAINYLYEAWRNKAITDTSGGTDYVTLYKDNASTALAKSTISDNGTDTFTKSEYGAP